MADGNVSDFSLFEDFRQVPSGDGAGSLHVFGSLASPHAPVGWLQRMVVNTTCDMRTRKYRCTVLTVVAEAA